MTVEVLLEEDWGWGVMSGIVGRYESRFARIVGDLQAATRRR